MPERENPTMSGAAGRGLLAAAPLAVADRVIADEEAERRHIAIYLSGAHAYGFPSPDSDLDLKAVHVAPTRALVGLRAPSPTVDRAEVIDGVEIDYTSNEIGHVLAGVLRGNGTFIERVLGRAQLVVTPELESLRPLVAGALSRQVYRHYRGFAQGQLRELALRPTVKGLLYVLRTLLSGAHLLQSGEMVVDLCELAESYGVGEARELVALKRAGERTTLPPDEAERWQSRAGELFDLLDASRELSALPEEPVGANALDDWLVALRRARF